MTSSIPRSGVGGLLVRALARLGRIPLLILASGLAGLLLAGLLFPVVGALGLAARASADSFESLPTELKAPPLPQRSTILAADGTPIATLYLQNRVVVPLAQVPMLARQAVIAIEDSRFYDHKGVDYKGMIRALVENSRAGEVRQGGSTLTQQYVKNVLIESATTKEGQNAAREKSSSRKLREARYALALEQKLTKDQILERYLNIAYYGNGVYGMGTAASYYFSKPVSKLALAEAALLAGIVQNPATYDPVRKPKPAVERRNIVLQRMLELGHITPAQHKAGRAVKLLVKPRAVPNGCQTSPAPFFCDWIRSRLEDDPAFGATREARQARLLQGGLVIRTTLDMKVQKAAQKAVDEVLPRNAPDPRDRGFATAAVVVQPGTGEVKAIAVNRTFGKNKAKGETEFPLATHPAYQAGSTFKVFTLAAALEQGIPLSLTLDAPDFYRPNVEICNNPGTDENGEKTTQDKGVFRNAADGEGGRYDVRQATWHSVNTFFVQLEERTGVLEAARMAERLGVSGLQFTGSGRLSSRDCSFTLGTSLVSPLDMATAYATLAAHGVRCTPVGITAMTDAARKPQTVPPRQCQQVIDPALADTVTSVLTGVLTSGTGGAAAIGRPAAGKTGTTNGPLAAWFVGYTPELATAVWMGHPVRPNDNPLTNVRGVRTVYGGTLPAQIWSKTMSAALEGVPETPFARASDEFAEGERIDVPDVKGLSVEEATRILSEAGFGVVVSESRVSAGPIRRGLVAYQSPRGGRSALLGTTVRLSISNGRRPAPAPGPRASPPPPPSSVPPPSLPPPTLPPPTKAPPPSPPPRSPG